MILQETQPGIFFVGGRGSLCYWSQFYNVSSGGLITVERLFDRVLNLASGVTFWAKESLFQAVMSTTISLQLSGTACLFWSNYKIQSTHSCLGCIYTMFVLNNICTYILNLESATWSKHLGISGIFKSNWSLRTENPEIPATSILKCSKHL